MGDRNRAISKQCFFRAAYIYPAVRQLVPDVIRNAKSFTQIIQQLITRTAMGEVWDRTVGIGQGVFDNIQHFAMKVVVPIRYDMNTKNQLVLKAADVVESQRIEWDKNLKEIPASFMSVRRTTTNSGNAMTFVADRSQDTGHAEAFWAITHALHNEPLNYENKPKSRWGVRKQAA